jgi:hypothetical protein
MRYVSLVALYTKPSTTILVLQCPSVVQDKERDTTGQDRDTAGQGHCRTGTLQDSDTAGQGHCRAGQGHCRTGTLQDRTGTLQDRATAGQDRRDHTGTSLPVVLVIENIPLQN